MSLGFLILAVVTVLGALGAMNCRQLVHCALSLVVCFAGLAGLYLHLGAEFIGFVQILVYVGAVAILVVFALLLTRNTELDRQNEGHSSWYIGAGVAVLTLIVVGGSVMTSSVTTNAAKPVEVTVRDIGMSLMTTYVLPLEALALLLTAALIGAVVIAQNKTSEKGRVPEQSKR